MYKTFVTSEEMTSVQGQTSERSKYGLHVVWDRIGCPVSEETALKAHKYLEEQGAVNIADLCRYDLVADFIDHLKLKPIPQKKCAELFGMGSDQVEMLISA